VRGKNQVRHVAKAGKNTRLDCPVDTDPDAFIGIEWKKDGEKITTGWARFKVSGKRQWALNPSQNLTHPSVL
jgi:hypothetical protein